jgi:inhibitor of cysteine peptidase
MKKIFIFGLVLVSILMLPLLFIGCASEKEASNSSTPTPTNQTVAITLDEFSANNSMLKYVETTYPGTVTVKLGSNPTTGYSWAVTEIVHPEVIEQMSNNYVGPTATNIVGAGGTEVWVFNTKDTGLAIIRMSYSRPWEGGEKNLYTVSINVNVK